MLNFTLGIIPARGGSKRLPRKNIREFCGKPLIEWTIDAANQSKLNCTVVSTDDEEIAEVARSVGGKVPFMRPPELATDTAPSVDVVLHALNLFEQECDIKPDAVVLLQPTSPLRTARHINEALHKLDYHDSLYSVSDRDTPNGCIYIATRDLLRSRRLATAKSIQWLMKEPMPDIDTEEDWNEAERLMRERRMK